MKLRDIILTASANMFRSKLRTVLTILAIFIGAFTLTVTNGIGAGVSSYIDRQLGNLGQKDALIITGKNNASGGSDPQKYEPGKSSSGGGIGDRVLLTQHDVTTLTADGDIQDVKPSFTLSLDYIEGISGQKYKITSSQVGYGATLDLTAGRQRDVSSSENQLVLPVGYVSVLGYDNAQNAVGKIASLAVTDAYGKQHLVQATIVGVQQKGVIGDGAAFNQTLATNLYNLQSLGLPSVYKDKYTSIRARIVGDLSDAHITDIKNKLEKMGYTAQTTQDLLGTFKTVVSTIVTILDVFAAIALVAASLGIVNTLLMSVQERTKEIGLMKAMGMRSGRIFLLFSVEATLIGFWGSVIGALAAVGAGRVANHIIAGGLLKDLPGFDLLVFPFQSLLFVILIIMAIAFVAGTLPARRAAKQSPIDALRYE